MKKIKGTLEEVTEISQRIAQANQIEFGSEGGMWGIPYEKNSQKWYLSLKDDDQDKRKPQKHLTASEKGRLEPDDPPPPPPPPPPEDPEWPVGP